MCRLKRQFSFENLQTDLNEKLQRKWILKPNFFEAVEGLNLKAGLCRFWYLFCFEAVEVDLFYFEAV